ncbi:ribulose-phosphate 3-epimerase-like [Liolophura sinensis]|uniref:ribulose-phosphate 3-epimerase-like n=1 Tax=Liolophura sinensis TaxID=3198878 RepID=UPI00315986E8
MAAPTGTCCKIGPSILNADLSNLASECQRMMDSGSDFLHLDVMDGHFVPNLTFGHPVVKCLRPKLPGVYFEMHMMVNNPEKWVEGMADAGADLYTFHIEGSDDPMTCIRKIKEAGMRAGVGIKPGTPVESLLPLLKEVDWVIIMTVEPGFGGQKFMEDMMPKVRYLRENFRTLDIEVDGGVGPKTIHQCAEAGANVIVSGSAVVMSDDPKETIRMMRQVVEEAMPKPLVER